MKRIHDSLDTVFLRHRVVFSPDGVKFNYLNLAEALAPIPGLKAK